LVGKDAVFLDFNISNFEKEQVTNMHRLGSTAQAPGFQSKPNAQTCRLCQKALTQSIAKATATLALERLERSRIRSHTLFIKER